MTRRSGSAVELTKVAKEAIGFMVAKPSAEKIDARLAQLESRASVLHHSAIAVWLRITFQHRAKLTRWEPLLKIGIKRCKQANANEADAFYGLM